MKCWTLPHPLCGLNLKKPMLNFFPKFDAFSGTVGLVMLLNSVLEYNDKKQRIEWVALSSKRKLQLDTFEIFLWASIAILSSSLFFLSFLLQKAVVTSSRGLLGLWTILTYTHVAISFTVSLTIWVFFVETFPIHSSTVSLVFVFGVFKLYICYIVRFYTKELKHEHETSSYLRSLTKDEISEFENGILDFHNQSSPDDLQKLAQYNGYQKNFEIDMCRIKIATSVPLGKGEFGVVFKGDLSEGTLEKAVAVKVISPEVTDACGFKMMLCELKVMTYVGQHPNVVRFIGANTSQILHRKLYIILELCTSGNLLQVLKGCRGLFFNLVQDGSLICSDKPESSFSSNSESISTHNLIEWSRQIAHGMDFLAVKRVVHGDLACRNILINDQSVAKITDFGLSRRLYDYAVYSKKNSRKQIPWRNVSFESIVDQQFSTQSDVWSYGITLWEIFTLGEVPYAGYSFGDQFIRELRNGMRPANPSRAPCFIRDLMQLCWIKDAPKRPNFLQIQDVFPHHQIVTQKNRITSNGRKTTAS